MKQLAANYEFKRKTSVKAARQYLSKGDMHKFLHILPNKCLVLQPV